MSHDKIKFPDGNADKEVVGESGLARGDTKEKVQLKMLRASICFP